MLRFFIDFTYLAPWHVEVKINKNRANILHKTIVQTMPQFGSILDPTWLHFGKVLAAKLGQCWHQVALKTNPKTNQKIDGIFHRFQIDFCWILASFSRFLEVRNLENHGFS